MMTSCFVFVICEELEDTTVALERNEGQHISSSSSSSSSKAREEPTIINEDEEEDAS